MGLFGTEYCSICGQPAKGGKMRLKDGAVLCGDCARRISKAYRDYAEDNWEIEDYNKYLEIKRKSDEVKGRFKATHSFGSLNIDMSLGMFYILPDRKNASIEDEDVDLFSFRDICTHEFTLNGTSHSSGLLGGNEQYGYDVFLSFALSPIDLVMSPKIDNITVYTKKGEIVPDKKGYRADEELTSVELIFQWCTLAFNPEYEGTINKPDIPMELTSAMDLFMIDSLDKETAEKLKLKRNALIKVFHPDENNSEYSEAYAQKINNAYDTIKKAIAAL